MTKNGEMTIFHGISLNSMMIPFENIFDGPVTFRGYKVQIGVTGDEGLTIEGAEGLTMERAQNV